MNTNCFYVYAGQPVAIKKLLDNGMCEIRWIKDYDCKDSQIVPCDMLKELTQVFAVKAINTLIKARNKEAAKYNDVIRSYEECMRYM